MSNRSQLSLHVESTLLFLSIDTFVYTNANTTLYRHLQPYSKGRSCIHFELPWGGRRAEGSGWGTHVYLWWIHFDIWQN